METFVVGYHPSYTLEKHSFFPCKVKIKGKTIIKYLNLTIFKISLAFVNLFCVIEINIKE